MSFGSHSFGSSSYGGRVSGGGGGGGGGTVTITPSGTTSGAHFDIILGLAAGVAVNALVVSVGNANQAAFDIVLAIQETFRVGAIWRPQPRT